MKKICKIIGILKCLCRNCDRKIQLVRDIFASVVNSDKFKDKMNQFNQIEWYGLISVINNMRRLHRKLFTTVWLFEYLRGWDAIKDVLFHPSIENVRKNIRNLGIILHHLSIVRSTMKTIDKVTRNIRTSIQKHFFECSEECYNAFLTF